MLVFNRIVATAVACLVIIVTNVAKADDMPHIIKAIVQSGNYSVIRKIDASPALTGWIIADNNGVGDIIYSTIDGKVIKGELYNEEGSNLSQAYLRQYLPNQFRAKIFETLQRRDGVIDGNGSEEIVVFFDPDCSACKSLWKMTRVLASNVRLKWIPVSNSFTSESFSKIHTILTDVKRTGKFEELMQYGTIETTQATNDTIEKVKSNSKMMISLGLDGTPAAIYRGRDGKVNLIKGADGIINVATTPFR